MALHRGDEALPGRRGSQVVAAFQALPACVDLSGGIVVDIDSASREAPDGAAVVAVDPDGLSVCEHLEGPSRGVGQMAVHGVCILVEERSVRGLADPSGGGSQSVRIAVQTPVPDQDVPIRRGGWINPSSGVAAIRWVGARPMGVSSSRGRPAANASSPSRPS